MSAGVDKFRPRQARKEKEMKKLALAILMTSGAALSACDNEALVTDQSMDEQLAAQSTVVSAAPVEFEPHKPLSMQLTVEFDENSAFLPEEAKEELKEFSERFDSNKQQYLTIRFLDDDGLDTTAPDPDFKKLANDRKEVVTAYMKEQGATFEDIVVDMNGEVADEGENNPMAKPDSTENKERAEYVVVTIQAENALVE